ncbi:hypothetical protein PJI19_29305, partial [Mycobacterium kansasii]
GMGGRKKKGIKGKIKEKLPGVGGHKKEGEQAIYSPVGGGYAAGEEQHHGHEKKGMMEKIKGHNKEGEQATYSPAGGGYVAGDEQHH